MEPTLGNLHAQNGGPGIDRRVFHNVVAQDVADRSGINGIAAAVQPIKKLSVVGQRTCLNGGGGRCLANRVQRFFDRLGTLRVNGEPDIRRLFRLCRGQPREHHLMSVLENAAQHFRGGKHLLQGLVVHPGNPKAGTSGHARPQPSEIFRRYRYRGTPGFERIISDSKAQVGFILTRGVQKPRRMPVATGDMAKAPEQPKLTVSTVAVLCKAGGAVAGRTRAQKGFRDRLRTERRPAREHADRCALCVPHLQSGSLGKRQDRLFAS